MSLNDTIESLANATITVTRRGPGTYDGPGGAYVPATPTQHGPFDVVIQPAYNMNRVIGGGDVDASVVNQTGPEVLVIYSTEFIATRNEEQAPDVVRYKNKDWTVMRHEEWDLDGEIHYRTIITRSTGGGA